MDCVVGGIIRDVVEWGSGGTRISLKTDQAESVMALRNEFISLRKVEAVPNLLVGRDPRSHSEFQVVVKVWACQSRATTCKVEGEMGTHTSQPFLML